MKNNTFFRRPTVLFCVFFLLLVFWVSISPQLFAPYAPNKMFDDILASPSSKHPCGTDGLGRDILSLLIYSTRMTFFSGISIAIISGVIGIIIGCLAGIAKNHTDSILVEVINLFSIIPSVFIILLVATTGEVTFLQYVLVASFSFWTSTARIMRTQIRTTMELPYIQYLYQLGEHKVLIILKHVIPHSISPVITNITLTVASACVLECGLSYIGVCGLDYSLGLIMNHGEKYIMSAWWITGFPIAVILAICVSILGIADTTKLNGSNYDRSYKG